MTSITFGHVVAHVDEFTETTVLRIRDSQGRMTENSVKLERFVVSLDETSVTARADGGPTEFVCNADPLTRIEDHEFLSRVSEILDRQEMRANLLRAAGSRPSSGRR